MATLTIPITVEQIRDLARQLSPRERQVLIDGLLAERFDTVMMDSDRSREGEPPVSEQEIQAEIDTVRSERREERQRAAGR